MSRQQRTSLRARAAHVALGLALASLCWLSWSRPAAAEPPAQAPQPAAPTSAQAPQPAQAPTAPQAPQPAAPTSAQAPPAQGAAAQPAQDATAESDKPAERALSLLAEGLRFADQQRWKEARAALESARSHAELPNILYHLARVQLQLGQREAAQRTLDRYAAIAGPHNPNRPAAEQLGAELARAPQLDPASATQTATQTTTEATRGQEFDPRSPRSEFPVGPVITLAAGGAALLAAVTTGLLTNAAEGELERNCSADGACAANLKEVKDRGETLRLTTNVLLAVGAAALGAGSAWWLLSGDEAQERPQATLSCSLEGCGGAVVVGF